MRYGLTTENVSLGKVLRVHSVTLFQFVVSVLVGENVSFHLSAPSNMSFIPAMMDSYILEL